MIKKIIKAVNSVFGNFVRVQSRLSFDEARKCLQETNPKPKGTCYTKNKLAIQYDLHIIIPAYNAENQDHAREDPAQRNHSFLHYGTSPQIPISHLR